VRFTEYPGNKGRSVTNCIEDLTTAATALLGRDAGELLVAEHYVFNTARALPKPTMKSPSHGTANVSTVPSGNGGTSDGGMAPDFVALQSYSPEGWLVEKNGERGVLARTVFRKGS
jgi:hypothetical protein